LVRAFVMIVGLAYTCWHQSETIDNSRASPDSFAVR
jgi:hypothetical protein